MYDRYTLKSPKSTLEKYFGISLPGTYSPNFNAAPTHELPIIRSKDPEQVHFYFWGLVPEMSHNKSISTKLINLPAASGFQRPIFRKQLEQQRCVIMADGFYLWKPLSKKQKAPYFCYLHDHVPFGIAGIWDVYEDLDGNKSNIFNMLTVAATHEVREYQDDLPAIMESDKLKKWLDADLSLDEAEELVKGIDASEIRLHAVSPNFADTNINDERLIKPSTPSDQHGNYTLFG